MRTVEEKVWDYLVEHKAPVNAKRIAKHFIISESQVGGIMKRLSEKGVLDRIRVGNNVFYKIKD